MIQTSISKVSPTRYKFTFTDNTTSNEGGHVEIKEKLPDGTFKAKYSKSQQSYKPFHEEQIIDSTIPFFNNLFLFVSYKYPVKISNMVQRFEEKAELKRKADEKGSKSFSEPESPFDKD